jgi:hypothetical protein
MNASRDEMITGDNFTKQLVDLNRRLSKVECGQATGQFRLELAGIEIPRLVVDSFVIEKCKVMNSKQNPSGARSTTRHRSQRSRCSRSSRSTTTCGRSTSGARRETSSTCVPREVQQRKKVATSVLGIAHRHPGNIMVLQSGHFFHIDFGHFLGNWKEKYGVKRVGDLFHFSPACVHAIGDDLKEFEANTRRALSILRENANLLITLFLLMVGTGIPQLKTPEDINFLKQKLCLKAIEHKLIKDSMESTRTKLNDWVHNIEQQTLSVPAFASRYIIESSEII